MALCNLKHALSYAVNGGFAVGHFNITGEDMFYGILDAAKAEKAPVIIAVAEGHLKYLHLESLMELVRKEAESAPIPVVIHLDHAQELKNILTAFKFGFTSVMFDGSNLSYEENIEATKRVVEMGHALDISVEGELGYVGGDAGESGVPTPTDTLYTDPEKVPGYVSRTGLDALAVSIGTAHGIYKEQPKLQYELLARIWAISDVPLVLHGGSGLTDEAFVKAVNYGIRKVNFYTGLSQASVVKIRKVLGEDPNLINLPELLHEARESVRETAAYYMRLWGSAGKSWL